MGNETKRARGIVILSHGPLAESLLHSSSMLYGAMENVAALCLLEGEAPDAYLARLEETLCGLPADPLIFIDVVGGTPFNTLMLYGRDHRVYALSGVNMPMLLEAVQRRDSLDAQELLKAAEQAGREGMVDLGEMLNEMGHDR